MKCMIKHILLLATLLLSSLAYAHDARPVIVEIQQLNQANYQLKAKVPNAKNLRALPEFILPNFCQQQSSNQDRQTDGIAIAILYDCSQSIEGESIQLTYPAANPGLSTLFRYGNLAQQDFNSLQSPDELIWVIPDEITTTGIFVDYFVLGVEHIWLGLDHLLFVACLLILTAGNWQQLLITITGFTLAHSVTLVLSTLNVIQLPIAPVEAVIALSILLLTVEIAKGDKRTLSWRRPVLVSSSFGLLHGFGFASVLNELGLPNQDQLWALLAFNVGVEVGQLVFIAVLLVLFYIFQSKHRAKDKPLPTIDANSKGVLISVYLIGSLAAFWTLDRSWSFLF